MTATAVYRLFGLAGGLLYVGISGSPERRFSEHADDKAWWPDVARKTIEWHVSRPVALDAEAIAIRHERPKYNKQIPGVSPEALMRVSAPPVDYGDIQLEHDERVRRILDAAEFDAVTAFAMATAYMNECLEDRGTVADLRADLALDLKHEHDLSIAGLAKVIGVSKGRTQRMLMRAERGGEPE